MLLIHGIPTDGKTVIHAEQEVKFIHQISQIKIAVLRHMETTLNCWVGRAQNEMCNINSEIQHMNSHSM